jgi:hypothetical protein
MPARDALQPAPKRKLRSFAKSLSANSLTKDEAWWKAVRDLSHEEKHLCEREWNPSHHACFSANNENTNPIFRNYFGRPRDYADMYHPGVRPKIDLRPTWSLHNGLRDPDAGNVAGIGRQDAEPGTEMGKIEAGWDSRHHVTVSMQNRHVYECQREYFTRFVGPRSERMLPQQTRGITMHHYPHAMPGSVAGRDDPPMVGEAMLTSDDALPVPRVPRFLQPKRFGAGRASEAAQPKASPATTTQTAGTAPSDSEVYSTNPAYSTQTSSS